MTNDLVTVVDVDDPDLYDSAVERFGDTPVVVKSNHGYHLWYKSSGERRKVGLDGLSIDVLGVGGYTIIPDSPGYSFYRGEPSDVPTLPTIRQDALWSSTKPTGATDEIPPTNGRNNTLFAFGRAIAADVLDIQQLIEKLRFRNQEFPTPLGDGEVNKIAASLWEYRERGSLIQDGKPSFLISYKEHDNLLDCPRAYVLFADLRRYHGARNGADFILANATRARYGWSEQTFRNAINVLVKRGFIEITNAGGRSKRDPRRARLR
jgi:hypothetical protein